MNKRLIAPVAVLAAALGVGGWLGYQAWLRKQAEAQSNAELAAMQREISDMMRDPESTRFRKLERIGGALCGEINAKNGMGGYVGYRRFVYADTDLSVEPSDSNDIDEITKKIVFLERYGDACEPAGAASAASGG